MLYGYEQKRVQPLWYQCIMGFFYIFYGIFLLGGRINDRNEQNEIDKGISVTEYSDGEKS